MSEEQDIDDLPDFEGIFTKSPNEEQKWIRATEKDGEEYVTNIFDDLKMKLIRIPLLPDGIAISSKTKIYNFKTKKWILYSELPEEQKDPRIVKSLSVTPEARREAKKAKEQFIKDLDNIKRL